MRRTTVVIPCAVTFLAEGPEEQSIDMSAEAMERAARNYLLRPDKPRYLDMGNRGMTQHSVWVRVDMEPVRNGEE